MPILIRSLAALLFTLALVSPVAARKVTPNHFVFVAYGDTRTNPDAHRAVVGEIVRMRPEFVVQTGDLVAQGSDPAQWAQFDAIVGPLRAARIAYYPAEGNHDEAGYLHPDNPLFRREVHEPYDSGDGLYYAFTRHRNRFLIVDSFEDYAPGSAQYRWLASQLAQAQRTAVNTFVMFHESPFSVGPHAVEPDAAQARAYLHPLFVRYKPRAVFCGHDHLYYRTVRDGVNYIVTGGGGAPLYDPENARLAIPGDVYVKAYHVVRLTVDGTRVAGLVETPDGRVLDRFTLGPK